jgi:hypothetical protein
MRYKKNLSFFFAFFFGGKYENMQENLLANLPNIKKVARRGDVNAMENRIDL